MWELCPELCACFLVWAAAAACEPPPLPNAPRHQTNAPPSPQEYPSPTLPPVCLQEAEMRNQSVWLLFINKYTDDNNHKATLPRSMSVKPSAARASPVFLSMFSRQRLASWGSSNKRAWKRKTRTLKKKHILATWTSWKYKMDNDNKENGNSKRSVWSTSRTGSQTGRPASGVWSDFT